MTIVDPVIPLSARRIAVIGHRGARGAHAENTIAAFEQAFEAGADAVELDVTPTRDGVLAVSHDPVRCDSAQLPPGIARFEQLIEYARGNAHFFDVEAKSYVNASVRGEEYARLLAAAMEPLAGRAALRSFNHRLLRRVHAIAPKLPLIALTRRSAVRWVRIARRTGARAISPHHWLITRAEVRRAHRAGIPVYAWTVNRESDWRRILRAGVDGIITDDPAALISFLDRPAGDVSQATEGVEP